MWTCDFPVDYVMNYILVGTKNSRANNPFNTSTVSALKCACIMPVYSLVILFRKPEM